ncbi:hypothetical protein FN846DRAFT_936217 [Sphaerosporella brunnea]|uniref:MINDY deubiquitinase domain-containing protein n=1 Tax=Sphaerosporella brunnea TaxID=1250544 RepID=A0A5J5F4M6_9PEZI|nr:hypothetical protein FN846DRAFT_936217 [Sphaerosporella brunnea]
MTSKNPPPAAAPPYPLTPEEKLQLQQTDHDDPAAGPPYPLGDALQPETPDSNSSKNMSSSPKGKERERGELPDLLKVGVGARKPAEGSRDSDHGTADVKRSSTELRRGYDRGDIPAALRPGAGRLSPELRPPVSVSPAVPTTMELRPEAAPQPQPRPSHPPPPSAQTPPAPDTSSPVLLTANLSLTDRPFSEYSPFYNPPNPTTSQPPSPQPPATTTTTTTATTDMQLPHIPPPNAQGDQLRHGSVASNASSSFDPCDDLSSFDASFSRAIPGFRGVPVLDGWQEDESTAKTWEEDLERRARAGAELQRRAEEAMQREQEERLQREFWEQEKQGWNQQAEPMVPSRPPKELLIGIGAPSLPTLVPSNPWNDKAGDGKLSEQAATLRASTPVPAGPAIAEESQTVTAPPLPRRPPPVDPATEIYSIKHVNLISPASGSLHRVPILLQNANGPCPLMALVNAITIGTPPSSKSPLSEVLRLREQISLSLLVQAVFEELMTRTPQDGQFLPDVSDLFAFLITLHTGMNVNPCFNTPANTPGAFEPTKEFELYAAFSVPLVHGWLPVPNTATSAALSRAKTYDSAQMLLFSEVEIITRLTSSTTPSASEPSPAEQQTLLDAPLVREFIESTATQLTTHGLETLRWYLPELKPSILFRNDHFSTILRRPNGDLVALVTDMGFAGHQEVVWERIADVNGRENVFLSGDFRPVGGPQQQQQRQQQNTPPPPPPRQPQQQQSVSSMLDPGPAHPPDGDYDLALAIQLQEEENARARHRQNPEQYLQHPPMLPPRNAGGTTPPPPYDQPQPPNAQQSPESGRGAWMESQQRVGRRGSGVHRISAPPAVAGPTGKKDEEKCVIM